MSTHLARLRAAGLVTRLAAGRHRAYRADAPRVKRLLAALGEAPPDAPGPPSPQAGRERRRDTPLRHARTCYDHLAGLEGVGLLGEIERRAWLHRRPGAGPEYELTASGARALGRRGVDLDAGRAARRRFAVACLDWTERRPHLAGALGAKILGALVAAGYVRRRRTGREVRIVKPLAGWLAGA